MLGTTTTAVAAITETVMSPAWCAVGVTVAADASVTSSAVAGRAKGQAGIRTLPLFQVSSFSFCVHASSRKPGAAFLVLAD
jgi:hypothetical protein